MYLFAAHGAIIPGKHHHRHFLCPLCSDQSSASSHEAITAACVSLFMCVCLLFSPYLVAHTVMQNISCAHTRAHTRTHVRIH